LWPILFVDIDYTLCKNIADLKITNNSGYEGLYVNFNTDDAVQINKSGFKLYQYFKAS
jgi:hypothetical protein